LRVGLRRHRHFFLFFNQVLRFPRTARSAPGGNDLLTCRCVAIAKHRSEWSRKVSYATMQYSSL
jgi:hypothetical protein